MERNVEIEWKFIVKTANKAEKAAPRCLSCDGVSRGMKSGQDDGLSRKRP